MIKKLIYIITVLFASSGLYARSSQSAMHRNESTSEQSFQEFRKSLHRDYQDFRSRILDHYADFLEGEWHPYEPLKQPKRDNTPKPRKAPVLNQPTINKPDAPVTPAPVKKQPVSTDPQTDTISKNNLQSDKNDIFEFYGVPVELEHVDFKILNSVRNSKETAGQWRALAGSNGVKAAEMLKKEADKMGFNGYLTFRLAEAYLKSRFPSANDAAIFGAAHFLMANMGYDVRLAMTSTGRPLMLIPFEHTVYASLYLPLDGRNYTAFAPLGADASRYADGNIYTCNLPSDADKGKISNLRLDGLNLPFKPYEFNIIGGDITLKGTLNENMMAMLYRYPQMPTEDYASSILDESLRKDLIKQVKQQLADKSGRDAVNTLMEFFHFGLPYATDDERHGFEKPYFLEETLYYDKCDCEDRAIMFTYLLWNALGIPSQLVAYPGHESASVCLEGEEPSNGYNYRWEGKRWWSADPTYIGSHVGDIMPQFSTVTPTIDKTWTE